LRIAVYIRLAVEAVGEIRKISLAFTISLTLIISLISPISPCLPRTYIWVSQVMLIHQRFADKQ
jgi:hypothetical protein